MDANTSHRHLTYTVHTLPCAAAGRSQCHSCAAGLAFPSCALPGLSDPEEELDDPGDFLSIRMLGGGNVTQLERLSTGLLAMTGHERERDRDREANPYRDRSGHGGSLARAAMNGGGGGGGGGGGANEGSGHGHGYGHGLAGMGAMAQAGGSSTGHSSLPPGVPLASPPGTGHGLAPAGPVLGGRGGPFERVTGGGGNGSGNGGGNGSMLAREFSGSSLGLFSRAATQTGHLIVAVKGPGDSLGFAGMARGYGGSDSGGEGATVGRRSEGGSRQQPVWSVNVCARSQVTAFSASIDSLHKLARMHPQVGWMWCWDGGWAIGLEELLGPWACHNQGPESGR